MPRPGCLLLLALLGGAALLGWREVERIEREAPERLPWTPLSLSDPIGRFTATKLSALNDEPRSCLALLKAAGLAERFAPPLSAGEASCGYADGVRLASKPVAWRPDGVVAACPVAAALAVWEREVVQLAARRHFNAKVAEIDHFGSYSCRRVNGRDEGDWSEHARARALDIAGFRLADGRRVAVVADWSGGSAAGRAFLRDVRDGACRLFGTVLSPDYNEAHRDHLHFDMASRGGFGVCR